MKKGHKLIFEGTELVGKSSIIHHIYDYLEKKYNSQKYILDGCHWFNCDVGIFGSDNGKKVVGKYLEIAEILSDKNVIFEKLHISDQVYNEINLNKTLNYSDLENRLLEMEAKIIFCSVRPEKEIFENRLKDRLTSHTHYERISRNPEDYIKMQEKYLEKVKETKLPVLEIDLSILPSKKSVEDVLRWIGEI